MNFLSVLKELLNVKELDYWQVPMLISHFNCYFNLGEVKTLMIQLLRAVVHLHDNWILHRDLKASNLLLSNKGILKVCLINEKISV